MCVYARACHGSIWNFCVHEKKKNSDLQIVPESEVSVRREELSFKCEEAQLNNTGGEAL